MHTQVSDGIDVEMRNGADGQAIRFLYQYLSQTDRQTDGEREKGRGRRTVAGWRAADGEWFRDGCIASEWLYCSDLPDQHTCLSEHRSRGSACLTLTD